MNELMLLAENFKVSVLAGVNSVPYMNRADIFRYQGA